MVYAAWRAEGAEVRLGQRRTRLTQPRQLSCSDSSRSLPTAEAASVLNDLLAQVVEAENELRRLKRVKRRANLIPAEDRLFAFACVGTRQVLYSQDLAGLLGKLAAAHGSSSTTELREDGRGHQPLNLLFEAQCPHQMDARRRCVGEDIIHGLSREGCESRMWCRL